MYKHENLGDSEQRKGKGASSAWSHDPKTVLNNIHLKDGHVFVDLGCGPGDYTIVASALVGAAGQIYALDKWEYMIDNLATKAEKEGVDNVYPLTTDILLPLPFFQKFTGL